MMLLIISKLRYKAFLIYKSQNIGLLGVFVSLCDGAEGLLTIISPNEHGLSKVWRHFIVIALGTPCLLL